MEFTQLRCPVCGETLERVTDKRLLGLKCGRGHSFDAAREGYVNLLTGGNRAGEHGDNRLMLDARRSFLEVGYYSPFREAVCDILRECLDKCGGVTADIGCGEGYYTASLASLCPTVALDISKYAVRYTAKRLNAAFPDGLKSGRHAAVVASAASLPLSDGSVAATVNLFAPLETSELRRVTRAGGHFIYAVPTPRHLLGLKRVLYDEPYLNEEHLDEYDGFDFVARHRVERSVSVERTHIMPLLMMTPYYYRTPEEGIKRLETLDGLTTEVGMDFIVYRRNNRS